MEKSSPTERLAIGEKAPLLVIQNKQQPLNLQSASGTYTLLSFWASYDGTSRMRNAQLGYIAAHNPRLNLVSVSLDETSSIFTASVQQDNLSSVRCYRVSADERPKVIRNYGLDNELKNYLLDSQGVIIARNVTAETLNNYIN